MTSCVASALVTPFKNNKLDTCSYEALIKRQIKYGMSACVPAGTTGESSTLTHKEHMECIEIAVSTCRGTGVMVLAGAGSNSTAESIELAVFAEKCGADGILCVSPYYNKPSQEGIYLHYKTVAESVNVPVVLYDVPSRCGVSIEVETAIRLFREVKNISAIKEASGNVQRVIAINSVEPNLNIFSGDDIINFPILASGGKGVISVTGNLFPNYIVELFNNFSDLEAGRSISAKMHEINSVLFCQSNPIPVKAAMFMVGLIDSLEYRLPLCEPSKECMSMIEEVISRHEVLK